MSHAEAQALLRSVERGVDAAVGQFDRMICEIIIERLLLEAELYRERNKERSVRPDGTGRVALPADASCISVLDVSRF